MSSKLIRVGGLAAVVGGVLLVISELLYLVTGLGEVSAEALASGSSVFQSLLFLVAGVLVLGGLVALYTSQSENLGNLGLVGFLFAFVGTALAVGSMWGNAFLIPALAGEAPALVEAGPPPLVLFGEVVSWGLLTLGWLLLGFAALRARIYPRWAAILLMIGAVLAFFPLPFSTVPFGAAVAWMGLSLLSSIGESGAAPAQEQSQSTRVR